MPAAPRLRLNLVALPVSASLIASCASLTRRLLIHTSVRMIQVVACLHANVFDLRPVALELMVRAIVNVLYAVRTNYLWKLGHISFAVVVRMFVIVVRAACALCSPSRLECGSTIAVQLAQRIFPANLASQGTRSMIYLVASPS